MTKDGRNFELDFKIDTYRDEIKFNKHGSQKKLLKSKQQSSNRSLNSLSNQEFANDPKYNAKASILAAANEENANFLAGARVHTNEGVLGSDTDLDVANEYLNSINRNASVERYKQVENLLQIPYHEEMGEINRTILRCSDMCFKINYSEMNDLKVATMK